MTEVTRCPKCGNVLSVDLGGRCPECMLQAGLAGSSAGASQPATVDYQRGGGPASAANLPRAGQEFGGYHLIRALGQGGMGTVFEAEERATGRRVALKVLSHSLDSPGTRQRFLREGRLAASVNHPHSVYVFGTEEIDGAPVIIMELVRGGTLQDQVRRSGPLPVAGAVDDILQVIDGLEAAQAVDVLHRDIKPSNCFVDSEGQVKIGDFGLSISKMGRGDLQVTSSGVFLGTPTYSSPEQLRGDELDQRSDQYAVGVTLFYLLTGKVPFEADQMVRLVATVLEDPPPDVHALRGEVPKKLALVIQRCLAKAPASRYRGYADLRAALLPFSSLVPLPANPARRFAAGMIDTGIVTAAVFACSIITPPLGFTTGSMVTWPDLLFGLGMSLAISFLYYTLPEGLRGATVGKWLVGLRVVRQGSMQAPGVGRASLRTALWCLVDYVICWPLLFVTMRRRNGFAGFHDLISGVRVIERPRSASRPAPTLASLVKEPIPANAPAVGPYHLLSGLGYNEAGEWRLGYDARLLRKVWVRLVPAGTAPLPPAVHNHSRFSRLRWLTGRRGPEENWDAFEAPAGLALTALLDRPHDWEEVRYWLLDLSEELAASLKEDTLPPVLGLDRVWITTESRAKLCDLPVPGSEKPAADLPTHPGAVEPVREFLHQVAASSLQGHRLDPSDANKEPFALPLPL